MSGEDEERDTGRTTKQLREAPAGAAYIVAGETVDYTRSIALQIGRGDLRFYTSRAIEEQRLIGIANVVVDHAAILTEIERFSIAAHSNRGR